MQHMWRFAEKIELNNHVSRVYEGKNLTNATLAEFIMVEVHNDWNDLNKRQFFGFGSVLPILEIE